MSGFSVSAVRQKRAALGGLGGVMPDSGASNFTPPSIAGLTAWYRADLGITIGTGVSAWADQSGTGDANKNVTQGTAANQPTFNASDGAYNSKPTLSFDDTNDVLISGLWSSSLAQPSTIYLVGNTNGGDAEYMFARAANAHLGVEIWGRDNTGSGGTLGSLAAGCSGGQIVSTSGSAPVLSSPSVIAVVVNGVSSNGYVNSFNTTFCSGNLGTDPLQSLRFGSRSDDLAFLGGKIAECVIYSGAHDVSTRTTVMSYLGSRYGISIS
jgi:hypothetical protein